MKPRRLSVEALETRELPAVACFHNLPAPPSTVAGLVASIVAPIVASQRVVGYILNSDPHRADIDYRLLTNIIYASSGANNDGTLDLRSITLSRLQDVVTRAHAAGAKVSLSIGCANTPTFHNIATNPAALATFLANVKQLVVDNNLDGIDLDWEGRVNGPNPVDYHTIITAVRETLPNSLLSVAVSASRHNLSIASVPYLDWVSMMGYDLSAGQHAGVKESEGYFNSWAAYGVPRAKLILGVPFYGKDQHEKAYFYQTIIDRTHPSLSVDRVYDRYIHHYVYYNGVGTMQGKARYVVNHGYGGVMIWELGEDHFVRGHYDKWSLLPAIYNILKSFRVTT